MFQARPISLSTDVWDRIDAYLNQKAAEDRTFKPNRSAFIEEAVVSFLDAAEKGPEEEPSSDESEFSFDSDTSEGTETSSDDFDLDALLSEVSDAEDASG